MINSELEICILVGGRSCRMGRDKSQLPFGEQTILEHIRVRARELTSAVRLIGEDLIPRCGPLSGVFTAFRTSQCRTILFLACDMPFVSRQLLTRVIKGGREGYSVFVTNGEQVGFPFLLSRSTTGVVLDHIRAGKFSLQELANVLEPVLVKARSAVELTNINTPDEWENGRKIWHRLQSRGRSLVKVRPGG